MRRRIEPQPPHDCDRRQRKGRLELVRVYAGTEYVWSQPYDMQKSDVKLIDGSWYWIDDQPEPLKYRTFNPITKTFEEPSPEPVEKAEIELDRLNNENTRLKTAIRDMINIGREAVK